MLIIIGSTYAYYSINSEEGSTEVDINTKLLAIEFSDGPEINFEGLLPGATIIKTFSVENTGNVINYYNVYINDVLNELTRTSDLVYTLTSTNNGGNITTTNYPTENKKLLSNIEIDSGVTQEYTLTITYLNQNANQSVDMNSNITGTLNITDGVETYNLAGYAYNEDNVLLTSGFVEVHSDVIRVPINNDGSFIIHNVPVGSHSLMIYNNNEELVSEDNFNLSTSNKVEVSNNTINNELTNKTLLLNLKKNTTTDIEISLLNNKKTVTFIVNNGTVNEKIKISNYNDSINVNATPNNGMGFRRINCTNNQTATHSDGIITVSNITDNTVCTIDFAIIPCTVSDDVNGNTIADIGDEITCGTESFYVTNNTGDNIKMLTKYNLYVGTRNGYMTYDNTTGIQDSKMKGFEYPGGNHEGVTQFSTDSCHGTYYTDYTGSKIEQYVNNYSEYLKNTLNIPNTATLITKEEMLALGCTSQSCTPSAYTFLNTTSYWLLPTGIGSGDQNRYVPAIRKSGFDNANVVMSKYYGVRPLIIISKNLV